MICDIRNEFYSVEYDLYDSMLNFDFINRIHVKLFAFLEKMFINKRCLFLILNQKFSLDRTITHTEKYGLKQIQLQDCRICL